MLGDINQNSGARFLLVAASLVIVVHGLRAAAPIMLSFLMALFLAVLSLPLLLWLKRNRVPTALAVLATVVANAGVLGFFVLVVSRTVEEFLGALPGYVHRLQIMAVSATAWFDERGIEVSEWVTWDYFNPARIIDFVGGTLLGLATLLSFAFLVLIIMIFVLAEANAFPKKLRAALGREDADLSRFQLIATEVVRYLRIKTAVSMATGIVVGLWVWLLGIDFPLLWGLVAFTMNYIPNIGSAMAAIPPVLLALVQFSPSRALLVIVGYLAINIGFGNLLEPQLMGRRLGLSPLIIVLSLLFWGWVWGVLGMFLAVPLTMSLRIMLEYTEDFRWIAVLLGGEPEAGDGSLDASGLVASPAGPDTGSDGAGS